MKSVLILAQMLCVISACGAQSGTRRMRMEAEYYITTYAKHYQVPTALARAIAERESNWRPCTVSPKGAVGLMQLMPVTARRLGVSDRCNLAQNISGSVHYLAWLLQRFHSDLRLVTAAYYVGEERIIQRELFYRNADVLAYVSGIRAAYLREAKLEPEGQISSERRDVR